MTDDEIVEKFFRGVCVFFEACREYAENNSASECSSKEKQQEIKKEVEQDDCNTQTDY